MEEKFAGLSVTKGWLVFNPSVFHLRNSAGSWLNAVMEDGKYIQTIRNNYIWKDFNYNAELLPVWYYEVIASLFKVNDAINEEIE